MGANQDERGGSADILVRENPFRLNDLFSAECEFPFFSTRGQECSRSFLTHAL